MRNHLQAVQAQTGVAPAELATPPAPAALAYLLDAFAELTAARGSGFGSPQPISWSDMAAWSRLTGQPLAPWEAQALRALDLAWLGAWSAAQPKTPPGGRRTAGT